LTQSFLSPLLLTISGLISLFIIGTSISILPRPNAAGKPFRKGKGVK
jgi:hypothetical protein